MNTTVFITGASGFVGGAIVKALQGKAAVRAMSRSTQSDQAIRTLGATPMRCELGAVQREHLAGCDVVIHCAAFVKQWGTREQFWQANVVGAEQLLKAARAAGVKRFIHIGTEAALFRGQHLRDVDETHPYALNSPFLYSATKAAAEQRVLAANAPEFTTLSIRPRFVWGPGDQTVLPVLLAMVKQGRFMWVDGGRSRTSTTHIDNLVHGVSLALTHGQGGNAYFILDDGVVTFRDFLTTLLATRGVIPPDKNLPGAVVRTLACTVEALWKLLRLRSDPPLTRFAASMMSHDCILKGDKAARELGYSPIITRERGLAELKNSSPN